MKLKDKVIVVTGGGRGIGRSMALAFKKQGARVAVAARTKADLDETLSQLKAISGGEAAAFECDVTSEASQKKLFQSVFEKWGKLDGLVCAAGIYGSIGSFVGSSYSEWKNGIEINLFGTALSVHLAYPYLKKSGGGKIILFSGGGQGPLPNFSSYVTSKGAIWRLTETLGAELQSENIFINAIAPGAVNTKFLDELIASGPEKVGKVFYEKSLQQKESGGTSPEKAADLGIYLMSDASNGLWGKTLSAVWDDYRSLQNLEKISQSDIFTVKRIVDDEGNTRAKK